MPTSKPFPMLLHPVFHMTIPPLSSRLSTSRLRRAQIRRDTVPFKAAALDVIYVGVGRIGRARFRGWRA